MNDFSSERTKPWIYASSDPTPSETGAAVDQEASWKSFGTSMNSISFGIVATAILISMFLIMAIFEHLFRPNPTFSSPQDTAHSGLPQSRPFDKLANQQQTVPTVCLSDFSVVMPGQHYPTHIAQPAPLPCPREGIHRPPHEHILVFP